MPCVLLWTITCFRKILRCHPGGVKCIACSHIDVNIVATAGYDGVIRLFNVLTGRVLGNIMVMKL